MDKEHFRDLCAAYVIGALDDEDRQVLEQALTDADAEMQEIYREMRAVALHLPLAAPQRSPSPELKGRIMRAVRPDPAAEVPLPAHDRGLLDRLASALGLHRPGFAFAVTACLVLTVGVLIYYTASVRTALQEQQQRLTLLQDELAQKEALLDVLTAPIVEMVIMNGLEVNPSGYGKIIWDPRQRTAILQISNLPPAPSDKDYQLWVIRGQTPVSAGVFSIRQPAPETFFRIENLVETDRNAINAFAITLEPAGGVPQPTGAMYLLGNPL